MREETVYGFFPGGDPRDFTPDPDCCTKEEIERWREACAAWNRGERPEILAGCSEEHDAEGRVVKRTLRAPFGVGVYTVQFDDDDYDAPEIDATDMIAWDRQMVAEWWCDCGSAYTTLTSAHADSCKYPEKLAEVERLKGAPLP